MSVFLRRLPCGCADHLTYSCWLARYVLATTPGMPRRPKIVRPWNRAKRWPLPTHCEAGHHGRLLNQAKYDRAGGEWRGLGDCEDCGGTVRAAGQAAQGTGALPSPGSTNEEAPAALER
jgi:hypothetical protein